MIPSLLKYYSKKLSLLLKFYNTEYAKGVLDVYILKPRKERKYVIRVISISAMIVIQFLTFLNISRL